MARQNRITVSVRYTKTQQVITYKCTGLFGRQSVSLPSIVIPATGIVGGVTTDLYWNAILTSVAASVLSQ
jgi:hypothetical protein